MATKYSPIKQIWIKDFRNIGEVKVNFDESPIVSLIGENEAGKTSVVKAFSVCALHSTPKDQKDYIRDGTNGFGVEIELEDGTVITRIKTTTGNRYRVKNPDGTVYDTTKIDSSSAPVEVQRVMGMIEEPETKEYLQVRTYEDQLLFVVTPASTNYKVMYDALKVDQITRAIKSGSKEVNELKHVIDANENGIQTLTNSLKAVKVYDITSLLNIKARLESELSVINSLEEAARLVDRIKRAEAELGAIAEIDKAGLQDISELEAVQISDSLSLLTKLTRLNKLLSTYSLADTAENIDIPVYQSIIDTYIKKVELDRAIFANESMVRIGDAEEVNEVELITMTSIAELRDKLSSLTNQLRRIDTAGAELIEQSDFNTVTMLESVNAGFTRLWQLETAYKQCDDYCSQVQSYLKSLGAAVETCPNCGEDIVIDIDKYREMAQ
jgi:AAA15 family ATPase/GTPase/predicted RNA-binding Zn-ribbon protein involved in translation (DUF1610 family)